MKKTIATLALVLLTSISQAEETYFFELKPQEKQEFSMEGDMFVYKVATKKIAPPKATSIAAYHLGAGEGREYTIQINLADKVERGWIPAVKIGKDVLAEGVSISRPDDERFAHSLDIVSSDPEKIKTWVKHLAALFELPADKVVIDLEKKED